MSTGARRWTANGLALCLLLVAIPDSDTATSALVLTGLLLLAAGAVSGFLALLFRRLSGR